jgi:exonuclease VII small subunit
LTNIFDVPDVDPTDSGQVGEVDDESPISDAPELAVDEYADHFVTVKVDGEDVRVPLNEALAGYSRQADYTRKTQELAQQRQELQWANAIREALDNNPAQTIDLLSKHYGISHAEAKQMSDDFGFDDWSTPADTKVSDLEKRIAAFEQKQAYEELERTVASLQQKYGDDFDANEVIAVALANNIDNLEAAYKQVAFDRVAAKAEAAQKIASNKVAQEKAIIDSKRSAPAVAGGSSAKGGGEDVGAIRSISDAWAAAKRQYGIS